MEVERSWRVNGKHYAQTLEAWLKRIDGQRELALLIMDATYGKSDARVWFQRWRLFLLACAELFSYAGGEEWFVGHYLLKPPDKRGGE